MRKKRQQQDAEESTSAPTASRRGQETEAAPGTAGQPPVSQPQDALYPDAGQHPVPRQDALNPEEVHLTGSGIPRGHALVDDIGTPATPEQEAYGGAGDLGTTGAVGRRVPRSGKVGIYDPRAPREGPGDTGQRRGHA